MSKTKKPKAWRECRDIDPASSTYRATMHGWSVNKNCWVIPDGAPIPQPPDVRRVLRAVRKMTIDGTGELEDIYSAGLEHERAEKRRGRNNMPLFRKKPVVIEANQWFKNGDHPLDYANDRIGFDDENTPKMVSGKDARTMGWEGAVVRYFRRPDERGDAICKHCGKKMHDHGWIDTLEGGHIVCPGDWIITGVKGEHYPCKSDIFDATYEKAEKRRRSGK